MITENSTETNIAEKDNNGFLDLAKITFLTPENCEITRTVNGFAKMRAFLPPVKDDLDEAADGALQTSEPPVWQEFGRVYFHRSFPFDMPDEFVAITDKDGNEYGVIRRLSDFTGEAREVIDKELWRKYFTPKLLRIKSLKQRFGYSYWETETDCGPSTFVVYDAFRSIIKVSETRIIISDVDGNRYEIPDLDSFDRKSYRKIELFL